VILDDGVREDQKLHETYCVLQVLQRGNWRTVASVPRNSFYVARGLAETSRKFPRLRARAVARDGTVIDQVPARDREED
jgi:hypothetical protein